MFTDAQRGLAQTYACNLSAALNDLGIAAKVTPFEKSPPFVAAGQFSKFIVYFRRGGDRDGQSLRVCWDTPSGRENRAAKSVPAPKTIADIARAIKDHDEADALTLAEHVRVNEAHDAVNALRAEYGLVEDEGDVQITETDYNSGRFDVTFKTGTPEKTAAVLKALRAAGIL
jgi:hypothetical protein